MAVVTPPSITPVPTLVPQRNDRTTFSNRVDAFVTWLITAVTEFSAVASNVYSNATGAFNSATSASTSASTASTQAGLASTSASTANTQAGLARTSASNAETSRLYIDKLYLGSKSTDPTVDNQGGALQQGANYYNSSTHKIRAYTGSVWVDGVSSIAGVSTVNGLSGAVTVSGGLTRVEVSGTTQSAAAGNDYWATNGAATTLTSPTPVNGAKFAFTPTNGLLTNTIDFGATTVCGPSGTVTGILTLDLGLRMEFEYSTTIGKWVMA